MIFKSGSLNTLLLLLLLEQYFHYWGLPQGFLPRKSLLEQKAHLKVEM